MTLRSGLFWLAAACCVLAELAILRSLLFGSARDAERRAQGTALRTRRPVEIAWAILPAIGLMFVLYLTWRAVERTPPSGIGTRHQFPKPEVRSLT
jgi:heme/copper-type cytochrome/quinol oxidase subunit 2